MLYKNIDLHIHTNYSDGSDSVKTILTHAEEAGVSVISITDHNTVAAYEDPAITCWKKGLIPGVEITCIHQGKIVEVLGYNFCHEAMKQELLAKILSVKEQRKKENEVCCRTFSKLGIEVEWEKIMSDLQKEGCKEVFWRHLHNNPENRKYFGSEDSWNSLRYFSRNEVYNPKSKMYVDMSSIYPSLKTAVEMIHRSGGIALLAHLYIYVHAGEIRSHLLEFVKENKLDGMECAYSLFTDAQTKDLDQFCREHHLLRSGGSDYHGWRRPQIKIGTGSGQLHVTEEYLAEW